MKYTIYEDKGYLIPIAKNIAEEDLKKFGEVGAVIHNNYPDKNPRPVGFKIKSGLKRLYAIQG